MRNNTNNIFPSHFREFIEALNKNDVEYLLIGGYAVGAYGHIRGTGDLDIFINSYEDNASKAAVRGRNKSRDSEDLDFLQRLKTKLTFDKGK